MNEPVGTSSSERDEIRAYLNGYVGRWVGDFTIHSTATDYSESFMVEQRYWWSDGELKGLSVAETDRGILTSRSRTFVEDGQIQSEIVREDSTEKFLGALHDDGLVWLPSDLDRAADYQMKESFVIKDGGRWLYTDGFDSYVYSEGLAHLVYRGRLRSLPEEVEP